MKKAIWIIVFIVIAAGGVMAFNIYNQQQETQSALSGLETFEAASGTLTATIGATGTVSANQSAKLTWRTSGSVETVNLQAGEVVASGDVLASLEQTSLSQNVILAQADLVSAQQAVEDLYDTDLQLAQALQAVEDSQQSLDDLFNPELQQAQNLQAIADAEKALDDAERNLGYLHSSASQANIDAQKAQVILAENALEKAEEKYEPYSNKPEDNLARANLLAKLSADQEEYDKAVRDLNAMLAETADPVDLAVAEAQVSTAQAQLLQAQRDYEQIKDGPTEAEVALAEAKLTDAQQNLADLQDGPDPDDIAAAESRVTAAEATLAQISITAPFDGVITLVESKPGDQVNAGALAFRVDDLSQLLVDLEVSEVDINQVVVGQQVVLTFDAILAAEYQGEVIDVALVGTETQGVVNFTVTVALLDPDENIRPGMTSAVSIVTTQVDADLIVPNRAVRVVDGKQVVYILNVDGGLQQVEITLGANSDSYSQVIAGELQTGDLIVINPPSDVSISPGNGAGRTMFGGGQQP